MLSYSRLAIVTLILCCTTVNIYAQCSNNALENPSFENGLSSWDTNGIVNLSFDAAAGSQSVEIAGDGNWIYQTVPIQQGQSVTLNAKAKKSGANGDANVGIKFLDGSYGLIDFDYATLEDQSDFISIPTIQATAPSNAAFLEITAFTNAASSSIFVDDFCLEIQGTGSGPKPDLIISNLRGDFFINAGDPFDLTFDLGNIGQQIANGDLQVGVYISLDDQFDSNDQEMIVETYSNTPIGGTNDLTAVFTTPNNLPPGNNYLFVIADIEDQILESNEDNNVTFRILEVGGLNPDPCAIELSVIDGSIECDDNNTDDNPDDDLWSFDLLVENTLNPDADGWKAQIAGQNYQGDYDVVQTITGLSIAQGALSFLVVDKVDGNCEKEFLNLVPPFPCSNVPPPSTCDVIVEIDFNSIECDDNGTNTDPSDDTWSFSFEVDNADILFNAWEANIGGQVLSGTYGDPKTVSGLSIAAGEVDLFVKDIDDDSCVENVFGIQPPATCSNVMPPSPCDISIDVDFNSITCDDNGTNTDPSDDTWSFSFEVNNSSQLSTSWEAVVNGQTIVGNYGDSKTITDLPISGGSINLNVVDRDDNSCTENITGIQPAPTCSNVVPPSNDDPDLTIIDIEVDQILKIGSPAHTQASVSNIGLGVAAGDFTLEYFLSTDGFLSLDDISLREHFFGNFGIGSNVNIGISFPIPVFLPEGDYFLITFIDSENEIDETNESNNVFVQSVTLENDNPAPPTGVCEPYSLFPWQDYIGKVKINEEGFSSGKSDYSDFRNIIFDVPLLESNAIELTAFFSWANYDEYFSVYIDFDQDGEYQADELYHQGMIEAKENGTEKNKLISGPFNINPPNPTLGLTTMRVIMSRDGYAGPCDIIDFGEVEDYSVNVVEELTYNPWLTREASSEFDLSVYPNPTFDYLNIRLEDAFQNEGNLALINVVGQVVRSVDLSTISEDTYRLDVAALPSGPYMIHLFQEGKRVRHAKVLLIDME